MNDIILKAKNISKQYRLGLVGTGTLSHDLNRWWHTIRGKEDPYLKVGETNDRSTKGESQYVWALRDINFEVKRGEVLGIIGKNGAGKSTLLKILSRVTSPTTGEIKTKGRIASLLEVGTGFHPEMTGRENIFLNGAILGMTKKEIALKLNEIIEFSGCQRYIDTPVKRYSSGMRVRLAFAVAAHLEPDILVVDEVLAVGDAEFQKKAIGKMRDISKGEGRTVLFVSHDMTAIRKLCSKLMIIEDGIEAYYGSVEKGIEYYLKSDALTNKLDEIKNRTGNQKITVSDVSVYGSEIDVIPETGGLFNLVFKINNENKIDSSRIRFDIRIDDFMGQKVAWLSNKVLAFSSNIEMVSEIKFIIEKLNLNQGTYFVTICAFVDNEISDWIQSAFSFEVMEGDYYLSGKKVPSNQSKVLFDYNIEFK